MARKAPVPMSEGQAEMTWEQLALLRNFTKTTGMLHDAQVFHLKMWALVFSPNVTSSEIHVNAEKTELEFYLNTKGRTPANFDERCSALVQWVQNLLGPNWLVRIKVKGKIVHRGLRKRGSDERRQDRGNDGKAQ